MFKKLPVVTLSFLAALVNGCAGGPILTPHAEDASAPHDFYKSLNPDSPKCKREVSFVHEGDLGERSYHELSMLSATCSPGSPAVCRRSLSDRACELHADALILSGAAGDGGPVPPGASAQSQQTLTARAVNWVTE